MLRLPLATRPRGRIRQPGPPETAAWHAPECPVQMAGCTLLDGILGRCAGYDASRSPCSPLFAPPERFVDAGHPFAFDVFSAGMLFLRLAWPSLLATDEQAAAFQAEIGRAGSLSAWLAPQLTATVLPPELTGALASFPADDGSDFALLAAMLAPDPARRPTVDAILAHPFLRGGAAEDAPPGVAERPGSGLGAAPPPGRGGAGGADAVDVEPVPALSPSLSALLGSDGCLLPELLQASCRRHTAAPPPRDAPNDAYA